MSDTELNEVSTHPDPKSLILQASADEIKSSENVSSTSDNDEYDQEDEYAAATAADEDMKYYERTIQEIAKGDSYVCMICTVEMDYTCQMYACKECYRVFDYDCIREWAVKSTEKTVDRIWKCPNCYHVNKKVPPKNRSTCWCGKVVNPEANPLNPNSCGQTCNAKICVHGCTNICHLGPHPECTRMLSITCRCGKHTKDIFCYQSKTFKGNSKFQCKDECGLPLSCGIHKCKRKCHSGLCGVCPERLEVNEENAWILKCYCGSETQKSMKCKDIKIPESAKYSSDAEGNKWIGVFACKEIRTVQYDCDKHSFIERCIAPPTLSMEKPCPYSPKLLKTCPCGKTPLQKLAKPRTLCTDPIPTCESHCNKPLKCGKHKCPFKCHTGACMDPCLQIETRKCSCEQQSFLVPCQFTGSPHCNIKCESLMSCRRHRCLERCCSGRPAAEKRKKTLFRSQDLMDETLVEAEHICLKECNLLLSCGIHRCQRKCHPGKCPPCLESDSNDLVCPCGKTIVEAPVRCGTKLPPCPFQCIKVVRNEYPCGHTPMPHTCHPLDEPCPPCTAPVFKPCKCGKVKEVRTLCFQNDVSCGKICGLPLKDCPHKCMKRCHIPGDCQTKCKQICGKRRINCDHTCSRPCHGNTECPDVPCTVSAKVTCECGRRETYVTCGAMSNIASAVTTTILECDEECEMLERHRQLKEAFGIKEIISSSTDLEFERLKDIVPTAIAFEELQLPFTEATLSIFSRQERWCQQIEEIINKFMDDKSRPSLHFKPMRPPQRHFIHELSKAYNLYCESQDPEPKRSVFIKKNTTSSKPSFSLSKVLPLYQTFKELEKERKLQEFEARTSKRLVNVEVPEGPTDNYIAEANGFLIKDLSPGTTVEDLERIFGQYLKSTLIKNPQYLVLQDGKSGVIYPEDYPTITANVERDFKSLVGHFDVLAKDTFISEGVELCKIDDVLSTERLATPAIDESTP
ncbi:Fap1p NDAI_0G00670 [Naumovozyma dairenensis CBS 421]|uniref:R3H domain-containing protein n=1 Tax=Naumovozyma dairenensis (strain ATCC 10597 / BCRC 20456 / CBS 421 / NBRC 0211 / NRRL Y-12639) TaxID=1071378 RepID=G0WDI2_NAUDC|nr:hypothetical protein NDAI_0G00670 [Naumovozyma dairenensis CBS 421]CCD25843.2 hypothetical protein NDAI_0G00670 [Naumovozyma dairenensis CBS 421]